MANKRFWLGMLAVALVFGMTVVGCSDGSTGGNDGSTSGSGGSTSGGGGSTGGSGGSTSGGGGSTSGGGGVDSALNGTWVTNSLGDDDAINIVKFNNGNFESSQDGIFMAKGTYTTNSGNITRKATHVSDGSNWYSENEFKTKYPDYDNYTYDYMFEEQTETYSVTGNTLTVGKGDHKVVYTKK